MMRSLAAVTRRFPGTVNALRSVMPRSMKRYFGTKLLPGQAEGEIQSNDGRTFRVIPDRLFLRVVYDGEYEPSVSKFIRSAIKDGDTCVDIGANFGWFTTLMAAKASRVFAYEPSARIRNILETNIGLNNAQSKAVVRGVAVGAEEGEVTFVIEGQSDRESALGYVSENTDGNENTETVSIVTLSKDLKDEIGNISLMKMDAEGYEHYALMGGEDILSSANPPVIVCEANSEALERAGTSRKALCDVLTKNGYTLYDMRDDGSLVLDDGTASDLACLPDRGKFKDRVSPENS